MVQAILSTNGHPTKRPASLQGSSELRNYYEALLRWIQCYGNEERAPLKTIGFSSCSTGAGATTVSSNLAVIAASRMSGRVMIVDANVAKPTLHDTLKTSIGPGFADILAGRYSPQECEVATGFGNLFLLPAGTDDDDDCPRYSPNMVAALVEELRGDSEIVIFDLPTANELSTCYAIASQLDGILLLMESGHVHEKLARRARRQFDDAHANLIGVVLNKQRSAYV